MELIDTHTHLFAPEFDDDRERVIQHAISQGVTKMFLPNINVNSLAPMLILHQQFPKHCFPMAGLHPCEINETYKNELKVIETWIETHQDSCFGIGETGLDYYWDTSYIEEQKQSLHIHASWAKSLKLPLILHTRNSFADNIRIVEQEQNGSLTGIFHCFTGSIEEAKRAIDAGFLLGIGGVCTFKNSGKDLRQVLANIDISHLVLETDSPYLAPHPNRGKRNESAYLRLVAGKLAEIKGISIEEVAIQTSKNAQQLFFTT